MSSVRKETNPKDLKHELLYKLFCDDVRLEVVN